MPAPVITKPKLKAVRVTLTTAFECGCLCEYTIKGHKDSLGWRSHYCQTHAGENASEFDVVKLSAETIKHLANSLK